MSSKVFILDASPIILLGKAGLLKIISSLASLWIVPDGVIAEIEAKRPIDSYITDLETNSKVSKEAIDVLNPVITTWDLGRGETEVLSLAMQLTDAKAVLDDLQARKCAALLQIPLIGSIGLMVMAKRNGYIDDVKPEFEKLVKAGMHIDAKVLDEIYKRIGE